MPMSHAHPFSHQEMQERLRRIREEMASLGVDALITSNHANVRYASGFRGEPRTLLLTQDGAVLYTSFRSLPWAEAQTEPVAAGLELSTTEPPVDDMVRRLAGRKLSIGVDVALSHAGFLAMEARFSGHRLISADAIERVRRIKSAAEIELLEHSQRLNESIFSAVLPKIALGMSERMVQGLMLEEMAKREAVDGYSFTPIVAVGGNAWEIHHLPDDTRIQRDDMLLLDLGVFRHGYASDMTRTVCVGTADSRMREVYEAVRTAQEAAIAAMEPGVGTHEVDRAAREVITRAGHGRSFTHGLGHSIGLETHDPGLNLSPFTANEVLAPGMAFTVEPGIYLENGFGVRTEDIVIVSDEGRTNLTQQPKELLELNL